MQSKVIFVKPKDGYKIFDPVLKDFLPPEGREVEASEYWTRLDQDHDVTFESEPDKGDKEEAE